MPSAPPVPAATTNLIDYPGKLGDQAGLLGVALARWAYRDDSKAQPEVRRAATPADVAGPAPGLVTVPADAQSAAQAALAASIAAGNPISGRQLEVRFGLTRTQATRVRETVLAASNGNSAG